MKAQEIFNTVARHLMRQGRRSVDGEADMCVYRSSSGLRCAVGCLIEEGEYTPAMEGLPVTELAERGWLPDRLVPHQNLLFELQVVHDRAHVETWRASLAAVADKFRLDSSVLDPFEVTRG